MSASEISQLELDLLLLFFHYSNQFGVVDIPTCSDIARHKLGVIISVKPFKMEQIHIDVLMDNAVLPDIRSIIFNAKNTKPKVKKVPKQKD